MDDLGKRISVSPVPKAYDATHGMCKVCGDLWLAEVLQDTEKQPVFVSTPVSTAGSYSGHDKLGPY